MSLKDISVVKEVLNQKMENLSHTILADIYELEAENAAMNQQMYDFDYYFTEAISLRENQIGIYNIANAICYCNYAKYLIIFKDIPKAEQCLEKAVEIFSHFSDDHPIKWLLMYCYAILSSAKNTSQ